MERYSLKESIRMAKLNLQIRMVTLCTTCFNIPKKLIELPKYGAITNFIVIIVKITSLVVFPNVYLIMWHVYPLLGNDCEISNYTTTVAMQRLRHRTRTQQFKGKKIIQP
jgi:hypothetical protein